MAAFEKITTVTAPASSYDLVALDQVKRELAITDASKDQLLRDWISRASAAAAKYCNRVFVVESITEQFWPARDRGIPIVRGGLDPLQLARFPLVSVDSVVEDGNTLTVDTDYTINDDLGQLVRLSEETTYPRQWPARAIVVEYSAGFAAIPFDVVDGVIRMVKARYFAQTRDPSIRQENIEGVYSATYWFGAGPGSASGALSPDIEGLLDSYRIPTVI